MALQSKKEELLAAWRALSGDPSADGWRTIPLLIHGACILRAGRHFPGNEEAILFGFSSVQIPSFDNLPHGRGFIIEKADLGNEANGRVWIALCRQSSGDPELFSMMADDVISTVESLREISDEMQFRIFLERVRAWQNFMLQSKDDVLSLEVETGLYGELEVINSMISIGIEHTRVIDAWQGPLDGIHDFVLGHGAIEVKSTLSPVGFLAKISSLDQLDDSTIRPLFLSCVRLGLSITGQTLSEKITQLRHILRNDHVATSMFNSRLLHVGYLDSAGGRYTRRFVNLGMRIIHITNEFPHLTMANVPIEIRNVRYEIEVDLVPVNDLGLLDALNELGIIKKWN